MARLACRVASADALTHDIHRIRLTPPPGESLDFRAGQYASVTFPGQPPRDYSFASLPGEAELEFHIRRMPGGSTSHFVADTLKPGDTVIVDGPLGDCYLRDDPVGPILGIAEGPGLAPIRSIVETAVMRNPGRPVALYAGARDEPDVYMEAHFRGLAARYPGLRYVPVLSDPSGRTFRRTGKVHAAALADNPDVRAYAAYLAGSPAMIEAALPALRRHGMVDRNIHANAFHDDHEMKARQRATSSSPTESEASADRPARTSDKERNSEP